MINKNILILSALCSCCSLWADEVVVRHYNYAGPYEVKKPFLADSLDVNSKRFSDKELLNTTVPFCNLSQSGQTLDAASSGELTLHTGFLNVFDRAGNAFVSAYRYYKDKECRTVDVHIEYIATPDLSGKTLLLVDPMLATGESMELAWKAFLTKGTPAKLQIACVIASRQGVEHLQKLFPGDEVSLWCGAIDPDMNEHSYIVPGLGDAGDLAFGDKL